MSNPLWESDLVQFARLICEIMANCEIDFVPLCESMDLDPELLMQIMDRADIVWEASKSLIGSNPVVNSTIH